MKRLLFIIIALGLSAASCNGPEADDPTLCQDVITRLCAAPVCDAVTQTLTVTQDNCGTQLLTNTGCGNVDFKFGQGGAPSRDRWLECRLPLIRAGDSVDAAPNCDDVSESFDRCDDLVRFLRGNK